MPTFGETLEQINLLLAQVVELDQRHSYVEDKTTTAESGLLLIDLEGTFMVSRALEGWQLGKHCGTRTRFR